MRYTWRQFTDYLRCARARQARARLARIADARCAAGTGDGPAQMMAALHELAQG